MCCGLKLDPDSFIDCLFLAELSSPWKELVFGFNVVITTISIRRSENGMFLFLVRNTCTIQVFRGVIFQTVQACTPGFEPMFYPSLEGCAIDS